MKMTYTIYRVMDNDSRIRLGILLANMQKSYSEGAMAMAETFYSKYHLICMCDQTDKIVSEVRARTIHIN